MVESSEKRIKYTYELLEKGKHEIQLIDKFKDLVLIFGNSGSGKSTFVQWITDNDSNLIAEKVDEDSEYYLISENQGRIGQSTTESKTIFPELVVDLKTNVAYYDCPGFSDTRNSSIDIANSYFIKKVVDHAENVKLIFMINYTSVKKTIIKHDFPDLTTHVTDFVKNIDKFKNSIAMVVSKVDNHFTRTGNLIPDGTVIKNIVDFLQEVKKDFKKKADDTSRSPKQRENFKDRIKFIDVLLETENNYYPKIGIFRRPDEAGPIDKSDVLREEKKQIKKIIQENLKFTEKNDEDFVYTVSFETKNDIDGLVGEINKKMLFNADEISVKMDKFYDELVQKVLDKIESFAFSGTSVIYIDPSEAQLFLSKFKITLDLIKELKSLENPEKFVEKIRDSIANLDIDTCKDEISNMVNHASYLKFLETVNGENLNVILPNKFLNNKVGKFFELRKIIDRKIDEVARKLEEHLNNVSKEIHKYYDDKMNSLEIQKLTAEIGKGFRIISEIVERIENSLPQELVETMEKIYNDINDLGLDITSNSIPIIVNQKEYLKFLQCISNYDSSIRNVTLENPFNEAAEYLKKLEKWYKFLNSLYLKFSEYKVQKTTKNLDFLTTEDKSKTITEDNFKHVLNQFEPYGIDELDNIKHLKPTKLQLKELNHVINLTVHRQINISCNRQDLLIKGDFISISDFMSHEKIKIFGCEDVSIGKLFKSKEKISVSEDLKFINVFALNTVFIDEDIKLNATYQLSIIAPKWEVIGSPSIDLNGDPGKLHKFDQPEAGVDGEPGRAGKPGGYFFGIGDKFIDGKKLSIFVKGGTGGKGQNGGVGKPGRNGASPIVSVDTCKNCFEKTRAALRECCNGKLEDCREESRSCLLNEKFSVDGFQCVLGKSTTRRGGANAVRGGYNGGVETYNFTIYGNPGKNGDRGRDGGKGGSKGYPGEVSLFELGDHPGVIIHKDAEKNGADGRGGHGGDAGLWGDDSIFTCRVSKINGVFINKQEWTVRYTQTVSNRKKLRDHAYMGTNGGNDRNIEEPVLALTMSDLDKAKILNKYKSYLRENMIDRFKKYFLTEFLNKLNSNQNINDFYDTLGLVDELQNLEEQFHKLNKHIDLIPVYQSLQERISEYAKSNKEKSIEHKTALRYLYTATLGRKHNLQDKLESYLIIDVRSYIDSVQKDIRELKELKITKNKAKIISKYSEDYKKEIDTKIGEAQNFIAKEIVAEIKSIGTQIDLNINDLINEVVRLENNAVENIVRLQDAKHKLRSAIMLKNFFGGIKFIGQVVNIFGPAATLVGKAVEVGSKFGESFLIDGPFDAPELSKNKIEDLKQLLSRIESIEKSVPKVVRLKIMNDSSQGTSNNSREVPDNMTVFKSRSARIQINNFNDKSRNAALRSEKESRKIMESIKRHKRDSNNTTDNSNSTFFTIENTKKVLDWPVAMLELYTNYKNEQKAIDTINKAIDNEKERLKKLNEYEDKIYNTLAPVLQNMKSDLNNIANKLGSQSSVALDVTKWKVQRCLSDIEMIIQQMTLGFTAGDDILNDVRRLKDAMTVLINVYNHIQNYQEDKKFSTYIGEISSAGADYIDTNGNSELDTAIRNLKIIIGSSIIFQRYQVTIEALKQFAFPYAHEYLQDTELPSHLELKDSDKLDSLVNEATNILETIKSKLDTYKASLTIDDGKTGHGVFSNEYNAAESFFVWKNATYNNLISELLSGEEIILKADIADSSSDKDAIKFNFVKLKFDVNNETLQSRINEILEGFEINMIHLGTSYFRYNNKVYLITTKSQDFSYYFESLEGSRDPIHTSNSYNKLKNGNFMLSPYGLWKIHLENKKNKKNFTFDDLKTFINHVDLELEGYGFYVKKEGENKDLVIDKYYERINDQLDIFSSATTRNEKSITPEDNFGIERRKREINEKLGVDNLERRYYKKNLVDTHNSQAGTDHEKKDEGWFSWIKFPSFNILPGAEAVNLKAEPFSSFLSNVKIFYGSFKDYNVQTRSGLDINGNLTLAQLLIHKIFGDNESLKNITYSSPEIKQSIRINKLASEILPLLKSFSSENNIDFLVEDYNHAPKWYQNLFSEEIDVIGSKKYLRNEKNNVSDESYEKIFADSVWIFDELFNGEKNVF